MSKKLIIFGMLISSSAFNAYGEILILTQDSPEYQECKKIISNSVNQIAIYPTSPTIDQSLSAREIADLRKKLTGFSDAKNHGMTYAKLRHQYVVHGNAKKIADGKTCLQINLTGELRFEIFTIYIENKLSKSSCAYKEILKHEQLHASHYKNDLEKIRIEALNIFKEKYEGKILIFDGTPRIDEVAKDLGDYTNKRYQEISNQSAIKVDSNSTWKHIINKCLKE
jgi:hypothetical protein